MAAFPISLSARSFPFNPACPITLTHSRFFCLLFSICVMLCLDAWIQISLTNLWSSMVCGILAPVCFQCCYHLEDKRMQQGGKGGGGYFLFMHMGTTTASSLEKTRTTSSLQKTWPASYLECKLLAFLTPGGNGLKGVQKGWGVHIVTQPCLVGCPSHGQVDVAFVAPILTQWVTKHLACLHKKICNRIQRENPSETKVNKPVRPKRY